MMVGNSETLQVILTPSGAEYKNLSWTSNNADVATVANGEVSAVSRGSAVITAKTDNGKTATCKITVTGLSVGSTYENISWTIEDDTLTISGNGDMPDFSYFQLYYYYDNLKNNEIICTGIASVHNGPMPWYEYHEYIKNLIINEGITSIGEHSFMALDKLESVILPSSLTKICSRAFAFCCSLKKINIPYGVITIDWHAFEYTNKITTIIVPSTVESVGDGIFYGWVSTQTINIMLPQATSTWMQSWLDN